MTGVLHTPDEPLHVLAFKKTLAQLFSVNTDSGSWSEEGSNIVIVEEMSRNNQRISKSMTVDKASGETVEVTLTEHSREGETISEFLN